MADPTPTKALLTIAAFASMGAGAVHASAMGAHAEHAQVVRVFGVLAVLQLAWGAAALARPSRRSSVVGVIINGGAFAGWAMAKTSGISIVDGLGIAEPIQWADGACAALALVAALACVAAAVGRSTLPGSMPAGRSRPAIRTAGRAVTVATLLIGSLTVTAMSAAATHEHGDSHLTAATDHSAPHNHEGSREPGAGESAAVVAPTPYDPTKPIDLGGVEGVTPQQQARAENLVAVVLARLPQFADSTTLSQKGFESIGDAATGFEHFVNWSYMNDGHELDPDHPESVVFEVTGSTKTLVSAMFFAEGGVSLDNVPDIGGKLTQWHVHNDLCFSDADPPRVAGITDQAGNCAPGTRALAPPVPMIHVWIRSHRCGPFAALDGISAGQVRAGETAQCDHAHGVGD